MVQLLIAAILSLSASGSLTAGEAHTLAEPIMTCAELTPEVDAFDLIALARIESRFRARAVLAKPDRPRMLGVFQLNERFLPSGHRAFDPRWSIRHWCFDMLLEWRARHRRCKRPHHVLAHHFGGSKPSPRAIFMAKEALRLGRELRLLAHST